MANQRIIFTVTTDPNYDQRMQRICTSLQQAGYEVMLVGRQLPHSKPLDERPYQQKRLKLWFNRSFLFYAEYNLRLLIFLLFNRADIICSIDLDSLLSGYIASKVKSSKLIHDAHELFTEMPELDSNPKAKWVWNTIESTIFPKLSLAYTESNGYQEVYREKYPELDFKVVRNVPFYYQTQRNFDDGQFILYQGALNVGRGLESAILAMKNIDYNLKIAGTGAIDEELKQLVREHQLENRVEFLGMLKPSELREVTQRAKIGLNLLDPKNRHYQLSFPNKLFDYIMAELPQISMNFPYYQEVTEGHCIGILIDDLEVNTVERAIKELLNNEELYRQAIEGCRELKEIHNWEKEQQHLLDFYAQLT